MYQVVNSPIPDYPPRHYIPTRCYGALTPLRVVVRTAYSASKAHPPLLELAKRNEACEVLNHVSHALCIIIVSDGYRTSNVSFVLGIVKRKSQSMAPHPDSY